MKILIEQLAARDGFLAVLKRLGHSTLVYDPETKPAFDAFDEFSPDIYVGLDGVDRTCYRAVDKCLKEYRRTKHFFATDDYLCAADSLASIDSKIESQLKTDVVFIGDHSPAFDKYITLLTGTPVKLKIFGRGWGIPEAVGGLAPNRVGNALSSAEIALNLVGPDMSPYLYQILISGTYCVSVPLDHSPTISFGCVSSPKQLIESVAKMLDKKYAKLRIDTGLMARRDVMMSNTYFHRVATMFERLGLKTEAERTLSFHVH
jgi:hypothetical protein